MMILLVDVNRCCRTVASGYDLSQRVSSQATKNSKNVLFRTNKRQQTEKKSIISRSIFQASIDVKERVTYYLFHSLLAFLYCKVVWNHKKHEVQLPSSRHVTPNSEARRSPSLFRRLTLAELSSCPTTGLLVLCYHPNFTRRKSSRQ